MNYCFYHFSDEDTEARKVLPCQVIIFKGKRMLLQKKKKVSMSPWWFRWLRTCLQHRRPGFNPWVKKIPWRMEWLPTSVLLPREFHG